MLELKVRLYARRGRYIYYILYNYILYIIYIYKYTILIICCGTYFKTDFTFQCMRISAKHAYRSGAKSISLTKT